MIISIEIRPITSTETLPLRREMLRPDCAVEESIYIGDDDSDTQHWGAFAGHVLVAVASLYREGLPDGVGDAFERAWRLRGMAVHPDFQGQGFGAQLLNRCLQSVVAHGGSLLWCNARSSALGFYKRMNFQTVGDEFEIPGVGPHFVMLRRIGRETKFDTNIN